MEPPRELRRRLLVVHPDHDELGRFLSEEECAQIEVIRPVAPGGSWDAELSGERVVGRDQPLVRVPVDGPPTAIDLVIARLARPGAVRPVVAPFRPDGGPVDWGALDTTVANGLDPVVDVRQVAWRDRGGMWWTRPSGPVHLPLRATSPADDRRAAVIVLAAAGDSSACPRRTWLRSVAAADRPALSADWLLCLGAEYLVMAVRRPRAARQPFQRRTAGGRSVDRPVVTATRGLSPAQVEALRARQHGQAPLGANESAGRRIGVSMQPG